MYRSLCYQPKIGVKKDLKQSEVARRIKQKGTLVWVDIPFPANEDFEFLKETFNFHPLALKDSAQAFHYPKLDDYKDYLFLVWNDLKTNEDKLKLTELDIFLGENYLVTLHKGEIEELEQAYQLCLENGFIGKGTDWVLYYLLNSMVNDYFGFIDQLSDAIDLLGDKIFKEFKERHIKELFNFKHKLLLVRKVVAPEREILNLLSRYGSPLIKTETIIYFQDIYDHLIRITDLIDTLRDVISGTIDIYLSIVSNRLNEMMKKLTILATIFAVLTLITGIYGMNFQYMPELKWTYGYFVILGLMFVVSILLLVYFRVKKWW